MSYVYEAGMPRDQRRRRALAMAALAVVGVLLLVAGVTWFFLRGDDATPAAAPCATATAEQPPPNLIVVNVYNATQRTGLAAQAAGDLRTQSFDIAAIGDDPQDATISDVAEIRHGPAGADAAAVLAKRVRGAQLVADDRTDSTVDLVLGARFSAVVVPPTPTSC